MIEKLSPNKKKKMIKEPTRTIYSCLTSSFWTKRQCHRCHRFFTIIDYQTSNYQLFFSEIGSVKPPNSLSCAVLDGVIVQLSHPACCSACISYQSEITGEPLNKND